MAKKKSINRLHKETKKTIVSVLVLAALAVAVIFTVQLLNKRASVTSTPAEAASKCSTDFKVLGSCNAECATASDCSSGLSCVNLACRLASNPTSATCAAEQKLGEYEWESPTIWVQAKEGDRGNPNTSKTLDLMSGTKRAKVTVTKLVSSSENQLKDERSEWTFTFSSPSGSKKINCTQEKVTYECGSFTYDTAAGTFQVLGHHLGAVAGTTGSHEVKIKVEMFSF